MKAKIISFSAIFCEITEIHTRSTLMLLMKIRPIF